MLANARSATDGDGTFGNALSTLGRLEGFGSCAEFWLLPQEKDICLSLVKKKKNVSLEESSSLTNFIRVGTGLFVVHRLVLKLRESSRVSTLNKGVACRVLVLAETALSAFAQSLVFAKGHYEQCLFPQLAVALVFFAPELKKKTGKKKKRMWYLPTRSKSTSKYNCSKTPSKTVQTCTCVRAAAVRVE